MGDSVSNWNDVSCAPYCKYVLGYYGEGDYRVVMKAADRVFRVADGGRVCDPYMWMDIPVCDVRNNLDFVVWWLGENVSGGGDGKIGDVVDLDVVHGWLGELVELRQRGSDWNDMGTFPLKEVLLLLDHFGELWVCYHDGNNWLDMGGDVIGSTALIGWKPINGISLPVGDVWRSNDDAPTDGKDVLAYTTTGV